MKQLNLTTEKLKKALCRICSISTRLGWLRSISLGLISLGLISLSPVLSAATVDDLTFTLINEGTEYAVTDCADSATGALTIPASYQGKPVTEIKELAFYLSKVTALELPEGLHSIRSTAFYGMNLSSISLPDSLTTIGTYAFFKTNLSTISLPAGLTSIGIFAFSECSLLSGSVIIPRGVTEITESLFSHCTALSEVVLHDAVTSIGDNAFAYSGINRITLPVGLIGIGKYAFADTSKLAEVRLEGAAPSLANYFVFSGAGTEVAGGTRFFIQYEHQSSYENSAGWSGFSFTVLGDPNAPMMEAFVLSTSMDASGNRLTIHSHGEPSAASASVLVQHRSSLKQGEWTAVASADVTESRDSESGVVTRSFSLSPSAESGFYRLHYSASESSP